MNELARNLLIWVIVAVVLMGVFQSFSQSSVRSDTVQYNEFVQMVRDDQVARVTIDDDRVTIHGERKDGSKFKTINPGDKIGRASCGKECVSTGRSRWSPDHKKKK